MDAGGMSLPLQRINPYFHWGCLFHPHLNQCPTMIHCLLPYSHESLHQGFFSFTLLAESTLTSRMELL